MKYLIKKLIKNTHQIECIIGGIREIQHSSSPTILAPLRGCVQLVCCCCCCYFFDAIIFFGCEVVFGRVLFVCRRFVGEQNTVLDSEALFSRHSIVAAAKVSASGFTPKEDGRS